MMSDPVVSGEGMLHRPYHEALNDLELQILSEAAKGLSNTEVALRLLIHDTAVRRHLRIICQKLGVRTRADAVAWLAGAMDRRSD